ncbi:MAG TPA: carbohydrate kinase family protein [Candidatus Nanoarchaeia archaeon]
MFDVITIGAATRDVFLLSKQFQAKRDKSSPTDLNLALPLGSKINVDDIIFETGGGATNAAVTFARQKLRASCIVRIGEDPGGKVIVESLQNEGVNTDLIIKDKENYTGYSIILTTNEGERTILVYRGASAHFTSDFVPKNKLEAKWLFISSLGGNMELLNSLVVWADGHKIDTAVIPGKAELEKGARALAPIFAKADVVIMNREEAADITGIDFDQKEQVVHKMCLLARGVGVITDGVGGATACDENYFYHIGTHGNPAVERTGAGDAFASGFLAGLIKSGSIEEALELAADNASNVVNYFGAKKGIIHSGEHPFKEKLRVTKKKIT